MVGLILNYTPWGIRLAPVTLSLLALTLIFATAALFREYQTRTTQINPETSQNPPTNPNTPKKLPVVTLNFRLWLFHLNLKPRSQFTAQTIDKDYCIVEE
jgi:hypothetical protein